MRVILFFIALCAMLVAEPIKTTKEDIGVMRKMPVYKAPQWVSKIEMKNGKVAFFCSPKSMFDFYFDSSKFPDYGLKDNLDIAKISVTDFNTLDEIDATQAFFVYGSHNISPAGDDLPAFNSKLAAENYAKANNGKRVFSFKDIKKGLIDFLNL